MTNTKTEENKAGSMYGYSKAEGPGVNSCFSCIVLPIDLKRLFLKFSCIVMKYSL